MWPRTRARRASMLPRLQRYAACRYNELELRWTTKETWVFQRTFNVSAAQLNYSAVDLLLTGVDTVAEISVDDVRLASTANAHRRARHLGRCMAPAALSAALRVPRRGAWRWRAAGPEEGWWRLAVSAPGAGAYYAWSLAPGVGTARQLGGISRAAPTTRALGVCAQGVQAAGQGRPEQHGGRAHAEDLHLPGGRRRAGQRVCLPLQGPWCGARPRRCSALPCGSATALALGRARGAPPRAAGRLSARPRRRADAAGRHVVLQLHPQARLRLWLGLVGTLTRGRAPGSSVMHVLACPAACAPPGCAPRRSARAPRCAGGPRLRRPACTASCSCRRTTPPSSQARLCASRHRSLRLVARCASRVPGSAGPRSGSHAAARAQRRPRTRRTTRTGA